MAYESRHLQALLEIQMAHLSTFSSKLFLNLLTIVKRLQHTERDP